MRTKFDDEYVDALIQLREAEAAVILIEKAMIVERKVADGPNGRYNPRKYQPLHQHIQQLATKARERV